NPFKINDGKATKKRHCLVVIPEEFSRGSVVVEENNHGKNRFPTTTLGNDNITARRLELAARRVFRTYILGSCRCRHPGKS
ncbi:hypothetical protein, partial [Candidatus Avelusimicrobium stercoris]|uniref:hypothetical protein n=1 Tax=Candidatus Avelusimicrobium stercoris TaxID=1947924 RepID=UPI003D0F7E73